MSAAQLNLVQGNLATYLLLASGVIGVDIARALIAVSGITLLFGIQ